MEPESQARPVGDYTVTFRPHIGSGTFGTVFKAVHTTTGQACAVKKIKLRYKGEKKDFVHENIKRELQAIVDLQRHPNVVKLFEPVIARDSCFVFMEYCNMGDMGSYLTNNNNMNFDQKVQIMYETASAISLLHSQNPPIIHRDIKLENILIHRENNKDVVKLVDFGLSKIFKECLQTSVTAVYIQGKLMTTKSGSQFFSAPELFVESENELIYDESADVFALGLVFAVVLQYGPEEFELNPLSVECRQSSKVVSIGTEMLNSKLSGEEPLPTLVDDNAADDISVAKVKQIIRGMTQFNSDDRKNIHDVHSELQEIVQVKSEEAQSESAQAPEEQALSQSPEQNQELESLRQKVYVLEKANEALVQNKEQELDALRQSVYALENENVPLLCEKEQELEDLRQEVQSLENKNMKLVLDKDQELDALRQSVYALENENVPLLCEKEQELEDLRKEVKSLENKNMKLVRDKEREFGSLRQRVQVLQEEKTQIVREKDQKLDTLRQRVQLLERENKILLRDKEKWNSNETAKENNNSAIPNIWDRGVGVKQGKLKPSCSQARQSVKISNLSQRTIRLTNEADLTSDPYSIHIIRGELWTCCERGINVHDTDLKLIRALPRGERGWIYSLADTGSVVGAATSGGLFLIGYTGGDDKKVASGRFTDVAYHDGRFYAAQCESTSSIHVYDVSTWNRIQRIDAPCGAGYHSHTLRTNGECLTLACKETHSIYCLSMTGQLITTYGAKGAALGEFDRPRICQLGDDGAMLVADEYNHRVLLFHAKKWSTLPGLEGLQYPSAAFYTGQALYIECEDPNKLRGYKMSKYSV